MRTRSELAETGRRKGLLASLVFVCALTVSTAAIAQDDPTPDPTPAAEPAPAPETPAAEPAPAAVPDPTPAPATEPPAETPAPVVALAPAPQEETSLAKLSDAAMDILVPAFGTLISGLVTILLLWLRRRFKLKVSDEQIASWSKLARKAALRGAEWARKKAKDMAEGEKVPGPDILEMAANWAIDMADAAGLPKIGREKLEGWIEAELFDLRREENGTEPKNPI